MASITSSPCFACTASPICTSTWMTLPGIDALTSRRPVSSRLPRAAARRARSSVSKRKRNRRFSSSTSNSSPERATLTSWFLPSISSESPPATLRASMVSSAPSNRTRYSDDPAGSISTGTSRSSSLTTNVRVMGFSFAGLRGERPSATQKATRPRARPSRQRGASRCPRRCPSRYH